MENKKSSQLKPKTFELILSWEKLQELDKLIAEMPYKYGFPLMQLIKSCEKKEN